MLERMNDKLHYVKPLNLLYEDICFYKINSETFLIQVTTRCHLIGSAGAWL